ncbi:hypothetical protein M5585_17030 [Serratia ureilytica]
MAGKQAGIPGRLKIRCNDSHKVSALPPGKSALAVPLSGMKNVSWINAASAM